MDFLLLLPNRGRIVIECDGIQHYADDLPRADSRRYAEMVAEDRALRLRGYEVYRFGGYELTEGPESEALLDTFFDQLASRHTT
ncbi:endonuclease domain-containing protein [Micromonospora cremea]|uniref:endonuclease domain-containing protein n=1 Tax=Micromonospora cremea TaxID=709881 RepID=UPI001FCBD812|nr:endonuclease domain-containing protein [Micromonospora cremea]